ncbi:MULTISPECIES: hypothetical protein [unclassified Streptomyces]|uniref:hypothetical protein n=1 Tax=unclassified Streptomyces TaxID=2593676 RepID=UPI002E11611C|nr:MULTISPECIES: hypothetical protein [unclassified Streptomyces]WSR23165.1 hypothetical protein OG573_31215 [Streptomyces sp. NBC_01205]
MRMRRMLGRTVAAAVLAGMSVVGAVSAQAAASANITRDECTAAGGQITSVPYGGTTCTLPDGTRQPIT